MDFDVDNVQPRKLVNCYGGNMHHQCQHSLCDARVFVWMARILRQIDQFTAQLPTPKGGNSRCCNFGANES